MPPLAVALIVYSVQVLVVVAAASLAATLFQVTLPSARLAYWRGVGVLCLALPLLSPPDAGTAAVSVVFGPAATMNATGMTPAAAPVLTTAASVIPWVYAGGVAVRLVWLLLGALRLRQIRRRSVPAAIGHDLDALRITLAPRAQFRWTRELTQPAAFGLSRPVILLPRQFAALGAAARQSVACHELLHVARRDWLWIVVEEHVRAVFWFHPAAWWVLEQVQLSREQLIDRRVVTQTAAKRAYMDALLAFADQGRVASLAVAFLRRRQLRSRLQQLSKEPYMSRRRLIWTMVLLVLVAGAAAVGIARGLPLDLSGLRVQGGSGTALEMRLAETEPAAGLIETPLPGVNRWIYLHPEPLVSAADVTSASAIDAGNSQFSVAVSFSDAASARMRNATRAHLGRPMAVLLDRELVAVTTVQSPVSDRAVITGLFTEDQANRIASGIASNAPRPARMPGVAQSGLPPRSTAIESSGSGAEAPTPAAPLVARAASGNSQRPRLTQPVVVSKVNPSYTAEAMAAKIHGRVALRVQVLDDGTVGEVTVTESLDREYGLDEQAVAAVEQWRFRPATRDGTPVAVEVTVEMVFTLRD